MVKINKIYTKTGDAGETGLVGGRRVLKDSLRVDAYGDIDELNSFLGLARTLAEKKSTNTVTTILSQIQNELFDMGSVLATAPGDEWQGMMKFQRLHIDRIEGWIDEAIVGVPELKSFVLPGGSELNAVFHICRTTCRRVERNVLRLSRAENVPPEIIIYLNRLSDLFFALARRESFEMNVPEYLWQPGK